MMAKNTKTTLAGVVDAENGSGLDSREYTANGPKSQALPRINTALRYGLKSFRQELLCAELTSDVSHLINLCDYVLSLADSLDRQVQS